MNGFLHILTVLIEYLKKKKQAVLAILMVVIFYGLCILLFGYGCPFRIITGISCPGCGMTRAYTSLIFFDFKSAFYYHPLFFMPPIGIIIFILKAKIPATLFNTFIFIFCAGFVIVYLFRMFLGDGLVVSFHPEESILYRMIKYLIL